jgi:hypothetical protein
MSLSSSYIFYLKFFFIVFKISFFKKKFVILSHVNQATRLDLNYHDLNIVFFCVANCVALEYETEQFSALSHSMKRCRADNKECDCKAKAVA